MGPEIIYLIGGIPFLPGPLERSSTVYQFIHLISAHWLIWSLTFTRFCYAPNLSGMVTGGENDRRRRTTTTTGPKRHQLNTIWHRVNTKSASKQHQSKNADVILDTLTLFSIRWCHSRYTDVIRNTLAPFLTCRCHSGTFSYYSVQVYSILKMPSHFFNGDPR